MVKIRLQKPSAGSGQICETDMTVEQSWTWSRYRTWSWSSSHVWISFSMEEQLHDLTAAALPRSVWPRPPLSPTQSILTSFPGRHGDLH